VKTKNGKQTQTHVLPNRNARMAKIRLLTRMDRQIPNRLTPSSTMDNAKRPHATIPLIPPNHRTNSPPHNANHSSTRSSTNPWSTSSPNAIHAYAHQRTRKTNATATSTKPRNTANRYQKETRRTQQVRRSRCLEDEEAEAGSAEASAGAATPTFSADDFHGCQDGGGHTQHTQHIQHTQPMEFHITELLGFHHIQDTLIHNMATEHTGKTNRRR
jgi:hypothetical protein